MTITALTHHCFDVMHFEWLLQSSGSLILRFIFTCFYLCYFSFLALCLCGHFADSPAARPSANRSRFDSVVKDILFLRIITNTLPALQGDGAHVKCPVETRCHCPDFSPSGSSSEQQEICWTQWISTALCLFAGAICANSPAPTERKL